MLAMQISITIQITVNFTANRILEYFSYLQVDSQFYFTQCFSL